MILENKTAAYKTHMEFWSSGWEKFWERRGCAYSSMFRKLELRSSQELELRSVAGHFENCEQVYFTTFSNLAMDKFYFTCFARKRCWAMGLGLSHFCSLSLDKSATSPDPPHEIAKLNCCRPQFCCHSIFKDDRPAACRVNSYQYYYNEI